MSHVDETTGIRLSAHPRARRHIRRAKGWGGLAVFVLVAFLSDRGGYPLHEVMLRATVGGIVGYLVGWALALAVWRQIALVQIELRRQEVVAEMEERQKQLEERRKQLEEERKRREEERRERREAEKKALAEAEQAAAERQEDEEEEDVLAHSRPPDPLGFHTQR